LQIVIDLKLLKLTKHVVTEIQTPLDVIKKEEEDFNATYSTWKQQYDSWREQNKCMAILNI